MNPPVMPAPVLPRPYPEHLFERFDWSVLPVVEVPVDQLVPSQDDVSLYHLARLVNEGRNPDADHAGWVVRWNGVLYLHNGHHRWCIARLGGAVTFPVRIAEEQP